MEKTENKNKTKERGKININKLYKINKKKTTNNPNISKYNKNSRSELF